MSHLETRLKSLKESAWELATRDLEEALERLTEEIGDLLVESDLDAVQSELDASEASEAILDAHHAAELIDACTLLEQKVLECSAAGVGFHDVSLAGVTDYARIRERIEAECDIARGFVYVAWKRRPEVFYYVGRATSVARIQQLDRHGKLLEASRSATTLTLVKPSQSTETNLVAVEASILTIIDRVLGRLPELNTRCERPEGSLGRQHLKRLGGLLQRLGSALE